MTFQHIIITSIFLICFLTSVVVKQFSSSKSSPSLSIFALLFLSAILYALGNPNNTNDIIFTSNIWSFYAPFGIVLLYLLFAFTKVSALVRFVSVLMATSFLIFYLKYPSPFGTFAPKIIGQTFLIGIWLLLIFGLKIINTFPTQTYRLITTFGLGTLVLSLIGATPFALGFLGGVLCVSVFPFIRDNKTILSNIETEAFGALIGAFVVCGSVEASLPSLIIFLLLFICEAAYTLIKTIIKRAPLKQLPNYSAFCMAQSNDCPLLILKHFWDRINLMMLVLGCFQAFAPNNYSIPLFCALVVFWQQHRIINWQEEPYNVKETTATTFSSLKENAKNISKHFNRKDN